MTNKLLENLKVNADKYVQKKATANKRRQVIRDDMITDEMFEKIAMKVLDSFENPFEARQIDIVNKLTTLGLSNTTIAKVVNYILPKAQATQGSIASLINANKQQKKLLDELMQQLEKEF